MRTQARKKYQRRQGGQQQGGQQHAGARRKNRARQLKSAAANRDKYTSKGKELLAAGERVDAEFNFQHAEHYARIVVALEQEEQQEQEEYEARRQRAREKEDGDEANEKAADAANDKETQVPDNAPAGKGKNREEGRPAAS